MDGGESAMTALRELSADEINTIAAVIAKSRPHGARRWDPAGIRAAFAKVANLDAAEVIKAALRLSQDPDARTPGAIANTSAPCWQERLDPNWTGPHMPPDICEQHGVTRNTLGICSACAVDDLDPGLAPTREPVFPREHIAAIANEIRDRIAKTKPNPEPASVGSTALEEQ